MHVWKHGLELKRAYRERRLEREKNIVPIKDMPAKVVLHPRRFHMNFFPQKHPMPGIKIWEDVIRDYKEVLEGTSSEKIKIPLESDWIFAILKIKGS